MLSSKIGGMGEGESGDILVFSLNEKYITVDRYGDFVEFSYFENENNFSLWLKPKVAKKIAEKLLEKANEIEAE